MDKEPTQKQIKEFWEKIKPKPKDWDEYNRWLYSGYPPIDLNNLFKYAVPKAGYGLYLMRWIVSVIQYGRDEVPALALFWALWQVGEISEEVI